MDFYSLITVGLAFFVVAVSPGPANLSNATLAMSRGRKTSLVYAAGLSTVVGFLGDHSRKWPRSRATNFAVLIIRA